MLVAESLGQLAARPAEQVRAVRSLVRTPRRAASQLRETLDGLRSLGHQLMPRPALSIQGAIGPHRRWAAAHAELADIKAIKKAFGGTVNDVVLAVIAGAFRDLLASRSDDPDHAVLRTLVPVSVRSAGDRTPSNQVSAMIAELPIGIADPLERLASMRQQMEQLKQSDQAETTEQLTALAGLAAPALLALGIRAVGAMTREFPQRAIHTVTTNVVGPQQPLYAAGRQMVAYLPFVPLGQGVRIGVAIMSYNGGVSFGVTGDYDTVPDLQPFCRSIETGIGELRHRARQAARHR
jgi:WS/DGAT/MGAT family acyltransferase